MKRTIQIIIIVILLRMFLRIPPYMECNHINIITEIEINCKSKYKITYKETIPQKEDNGIKYTYKTYQVQNKDLKKGIKEIEWKKEIYKEQAKVKISNCKNKRKIKRVLGIS